MSQDGYVTPVATSLPSGSPRTRMVRGIFPLLFPLLPPAPHKAGPLWNRRRHPRESEGGPAEALTPAAAAAATAVRSQSGYVRGAVPPAPKTKKNKTKAEENGGGGGSGGGGGGLAPPLGVSRRARQPCGLIPESVIAKVRVRQKRKQACALLLAARFVFRWRSGLR